MRFHALSHASSGTDYACRQCPSSPSMSDAPENLCDGKPLLALLGGLSDAPPSPNNLILTKLECSVWAKNTLSSRALPTSGRRWAAASWRSETRPKFPPGGGGYPKDSALNTSSFAGFSDTTIQVELSENLSNSGGFPPILNDMTPFSLDFR